MIRHGEQGRRMRIAITGANSSVGRALLRHVVGLADVEVRAGARTPQALATLPIGTAITPAVIRYDDGASLAALLAGADCLVHLAGILIESRHTSYQTANIDATQAVVDGAREAGVEHLVLVSAVGADPSSRNAYYRSKGEAERIVERAGTAATIIRTPMLLGPGSAGARSLVGLASRRSVRVPGGGHHTLRPLDLDDLSVAIVSACRQTRGGVVLHELVGPEPVTYRNLIMRTGRLMGHDVSVGGAPVWGIKLASWLAGWFRRGGMTPTVIDVITASETVLANADADLSVTLTPVSATLEKLLAVGDAQT